MLRDHFGEEVGLALTLNRTGLLPSALVSCLALLGGLGAPVVPASGGEASRSVGAGHQGQLHDDLPAADSGRVRLVMVAIVGCPFCLRWERRVGHAYPTSAQGKFASLIRVKLGAQGLTKFRNIKYTPTFLVLNGQEEIGRISGFPGAEPFWEELDEILVKHGFEAGG
ncbi:MAG: hypothetical protein K0U34_08215 [Alphaproteobacteria bacterium]|nr:hypothetical protein [Alphaproteobacteria bacterium]